MTKGRRRFFGGAKLGKLTIGDAFGIAITRSITERVLTPIIGNATIMSGILKIGTAMAVMNFGKGNFAKIIGTALVVDGGEDIITPLITGGFGGMQLFGGGIGGGNEQVI